MITFLYLVVVVVLATLQTGFFGELRPLGVVPNLMLVAVIFCGLNSTASRAVVMALGGGLLLDLSSGEDFGLRMALLTLIALAVIFFRQQGFDLDSLGMVVGLTAIGTVVCDSAFLGELGQQVVGSQLGQVVRVMLQEILVNCSFMALAHLIFRGMGGGQIRGEPGLRKRTFLWLR